ncbi:MAG: XTP/dITP diphosphatase [Clostridia bacterium]|nr:XTP/dITP diphosphatase [Clostridia bacterium]
MQRIIIATSNEGKMKEFRALLSHKDVEIVSMKEAGIDIDIDENGTTFEENAAIKAKTVCDYSGCLCLSDDSGLVIDYLGGEPGIYSARYLGHDTPYEEKNRIIIDRLKGVPEENRTARFVCAVAAAFPDGRVLTVKDTFEGRIADEPAGCGGFGYDPIFFFPPAGMTSAEMTAEEKNAVSHRGKALRKMVALLEKEI